MTRYWARCLMLEKHINFLCGYFHRLGIFNTELILDIQKLHGIHLVEFELKTQLVHGEKNLIRG